VCVFCRSDDKEGLESYLASSGIEGINQVLSINQVKKIVDRFDDKKKLLAEHTHFICDARIVPQLYNLLGRVFAARNNYPIPINLDVQKTQRIPIDIAKVLNSTYIHLKGKNVTIRIGHSDMTADHISANISEGLAFAVEKFPGGARSVHSVHVKLADSAALPIYSKTSSKVIDYMKKQGGKRSAASEADEGDNGSPKQKKGKSSKATPGKVVKKTPSKVGSLRKRQA
jgi:ribosome biogenesis protein UTP30